MSNDIERIDWWEKENLVETEGLFYFTHNPKHEAVVTNSGITLDEFNKLVCDKP